MKKFLRAKDYPGRFVPADTWATRLSAGPKMTLALAVVLCAFWTRTPVLAGSLALLVCLLYFCSGLARRLRHDALLFLVQFPLLFTLYLFAEPLPRALERAATLSMQIGCSVLPFLWVQRTTTPGDAVRSLSRIVSGRTAFLLTASLRFFPIVLRDMRTIYTIQLLRGAPIRLGQAVHPKTMFRSFSALARHVGLPLMVRMLKLAQEASLATRARGLDRATHFSNLHARPTTAQPPATQDDRPQPPSSPPGDEA